MKKVLALLFLATLIVAGCTTAEKQVKVEKPAKVLSGENHFTVWKYSGRHYVTGSETMNNKFAKNHHLPYTKTILGAGPHGETVVFEVNKKDSAYVENLMDTYNHTPFLLESKNDNYSVYKYNGRIYVIGSPKIRDFFVQHKHLPYTKTLLGAGPGNETVIFEADKKDPAFAEKLIAIYKG